MKITQKYLRKLILETLEEIYVPGKEEDKFVYPKTGNVTATAPKITKIPRLKNPFGEGPEKRQEFLSIFKPVISFSHNMPSSEKKPTVDLSKFEPKRALTTILSSINYRRNTNKSSNNTTSINVNKDFGSSFSPQEIQKIADAIQQKGLLVNGDYVEEIYRNLGGEITSYVPSVTDDEGPKTVNMKRPGPFNEEKAKKTKIKYKCN